MSAKDFYNLVNSNIETEYRLISFFRDEYISEYEFNCDRQSVRDAIVGVFNIPHNHLAFVDEYSTYLATRIYT